MDGKTVLVIDDDLDVLDAVRLALEDADFSVATATTGDEGLARLRQGDVDALILDVMLARDTEGFQLAQTLKEDETLKGIPILIMTSVGTKTGFSFDPETDGDYLPVEDYVEKPIGPSELVVRVRKLLGQ
jgi:DNA-binding response OmpR family regulator